MLKLISAAGEQGVFGKRTNILDVCFAFDYMILPENLELIPLSCETISQINEKPKRIFSIGISVNSFIYANIYKKQIEGFISRYYLGKYKIIITFTPL